MACQAYAPELVGRSQRLIPAQQMGITQELFFITKQP